MSLYSWKQLARWSIDYSCLSEKEQKEGHKYLDESWEQFCHDVVNTYGPSVMHTDEEIARDPVLKDRVDPAKAAAYYGDDGEARWKSYTKKRGNKKYLEL
ncbi:Cat eye syndrome critical region protein 1 [Pyrenophora tritici-repentis]|nr:Cat eye syndrome critical region protein 1 [Pyrenophora tritici-repentis]